MFDGSASLKLEKTLKFTINMTNIARRELDKTCTPHTDEPWWPPSSHGYHGAPLPALRHTTISRHITQ